MIDKLVDRGFDKVCDNQVLLIYEKGMDKITINKIAKTIKAENTFNGRGLELSFIELKIIYEMISEMED
ncbi:hypothetical protein B5F14_06505 [Faecalitalea cylindroides]|jgi:hypothetical protein|uniref:Uncharacterized protein n=1 Tax=Faecalitalea cylindroides TaxID=39483 RepID=A0A1Y4LTV2_9FIRM|nr:hypothetical protein [Faecalitalea cylindroides]OUP60065.1 hypothetical protein B5F14_06505 [Faecalitalea cylindroides]